MKDLTAFLKRHHLVACFIALASIFTLSSCLDNEDNSPVVHITGIFLNGKEVTTNVPTVPVGDTLQVDVALNGLGTDLVFFQLEYDRKFMKDTLFTTLKPMDWEMLFNKNTNPAKGYYEFNPGWNLVHTPMYFIPQQVKQDDKEPLEVLFILKNASTSDDKFNPYRLRLPIQIVEKKAEENTNKK